MNNATPRTQNREWGFFGTCVTQGHTNPEAAWDEVMEILTSLQGRFRFEPEVARDVLDSTWGRHLADSLAGKEFEPTIEELTKNEKWMRTTLMVAEAIVLARTDSGE